MKRKTKTTIPESAQELMKLINEDIDLAKSTPSLDWDLGDTWKSIRNRRLYSTKTHLQNNDFKIIKKDAIYTIFNELYKEAYEQIMETASHDDSETQKYKYWNKFMIAQGLLPDELPKTKDDIPKGLIPDDLSISLWTLYEDYDIDFDLGDDGTDEREMAHERITQLLDDLQKSFEPSLWTHWYVAEVTIKEELLNEGAPGLGNVLLYYNTLNIIANLELEYYGSIQWLITYIADYFDHSNPKLFI